MKKAVFLSPILLILAILSGCNLPLGSSGQSISQEDLIALYVAQTQQAKHSNTGGNNGDGVSLIEQPPTLTLMPTITLTPTLEVTMVSVSVDTNCRTGPGKVYDYIGALLVGEHAEVVGQSMDGIYWIIKNPDQNGECWLWGQYATIIGQTTNIKKFTPPPTPTPTFNWEGSWTIYESTSDNPSPEASLSPLVVTVDGKVFSGYIDLGGQSNVITLTGTISDDYLSVSGTWSPSGPVHTFTFYALGTNQFQGNGDNGNEVWGWCGSRGGAGVPSPCFHP